MRLTRVQYFARQRTGTLVRLVLHNMWRVTQAVDYTYPTGYVAHSSRFRVVS